MLLSNSSLCWLLIPDWEACPRVGVGVGGGGLEGGALIASI